MIKHGIFLLCVYVCAATAAARACTLDFNPVCGSDGKLYSNECFFNAKIQNNPNLEKVSLDKCQVRKQTQQETPACFCTLEYDPQCGSDGSTYPNKCTLECEKKKNNKLEVKHRGECRENEKVTDKSEQKENEKKATDAPTKFTCGCTDNYMPVCGSDGTTYPNKCELNCAKNENSDIKINHPGECQKQDLKSVPNPNLENVETDKRKSQNAYESCVCTFNYKPVCGNDGKTYPNKCALDCRKHLTPSLEMKHPGQCRSAALMMKPSCPCTREYDPICGTDGETYNNLCLLGCAQKLVNVQFKHDGECKKNARSRRDVHNRESLCACPKNLRRVCGTNGKTYLNPCLLECAAKNNKNIKYHHEGSC